MQCFFHITEIPFVVFFCIGDSVREFFLRVAALTFEARVLAELERNNNKQVDGIVSKCPSVNQAC